MVSEQYEKMTFPEHDNPVVAYSGAGVLHHAYRLLEDWGVSTLMVVCGQSVSRLEAVNAFIADAPGDISVEVFDEVEPDPSDTTCVNGGRRARECGAEAVIGIGGGSSMDAAKAISAEAITPGWALAQDHPGEPTEIDFDPLPVILAPTTAGTASEVTPFSVITYTETERKLVLNHPRLYAKNALLDPQLLTTAPQEVRMAAGMDALTHALESLVSKRATDQTRSRCLESIELVSANLERVVANPENLQAQSAVQNGAMIAGLAFSKSRLGIVHAMALPLSALFHVPHGTANAVLLPYGMQYNYRADTENYAKAARAMGVDTSELCEEKAALAAVEAVQQLSDAVGAPSSMSEVGVEEEAIPQMAQDAIQSAHIACNPREIELGDLVEVYHKAY
ncbi:MAG: iron-containing alcohol dehydrogenase family protein [Armatimonadota bacterium]